MTGFDKDWLALREPADRNARNPQLMEQMVKHLKEAEACPIILDIGCGTGSTYRTLSPHMSANARWKLLDYEASLLAEAARQIGKSSKVEFHRQDLNNLDETLLEGVGMVTASALFDLCSAEFCRSFIKTIARHRVGLYAALNYNGVMAWTIPHALDQQVVLAFNAHQRIDKGFGPALGPGASEYLVRIASEQGYRCHSEESNWRMGPDSADLQNAFLDGIETPLKEIGTIDMEPLSQWLDFRRSKISESGSVCTVGHTDILALFEG